MSSLDLFYIDELILVRESQHGGDRGAPQVIGGHRVGTSINRSCVVMLSALLQGFVEDVFITASQRKFTNLKTDNDVAKYRKTFRLWGNPNPDNIENLFLRLYIEEALKGLSWQKCDNESVKNKLREINEVRNGIAHGKKDLTFKQKPVSLSLAKVRSYRNFAESLDNILRSIPFVNADTLDNQSSMLLHRTPI